MSVVRYSKVSEVDRYFGSKTSNRNTLNLPRWYNNDMHIVSNGVVPSPNNPLLVLLVVAYMQQVVMFT